MIKISNPANCCGCAACANICPLNCIKMAPSKEGFLYPKIDINICINCGKCESICPMIVKSRDIQSLSNKIYACISNNSKYRSLASSGAIFPMLMEWFINNEGYVFGVVISDDFNIVHEDASGTINTKLFGSKYVQSQIGNSFMKVKELLLQEKIVLFTGTPCQVAGLKNYLGVEYKRLYTLDVACHGVSSPAIWKKYLQYQVDKEKSDITNFSFRDKSKGWRSYSVSMTFANGQKIYENVNNNLLMKTYLNNFNLRDSCYQCHYKRKNNISDITLADFWGCWEIEPDLYDNNGTSLVFINSKKGQILFNQIKDKMLYKLVSEDKIKKYNSSIYLSTLMPFNRDAFFKDIFLLPFDKAVIKHTKKSIIKRIKAKLSKLNMK